MNHRYLSLLKRDFLRDMENSFDRIVDSFSRTYISYPEETEFICINWDSFVDMTHVGDPRLREIISFASHSYDLFPDSFIECLNFIEFFVSHEINDDGSPTIIWVKKERCGETVKYVPSSSEDEKSQPYLLRHDNFLPEAMIFQRTATSGQDIKEIEKAIKFCDNKKSKIKSPTIRKYSPTKLQQELSTFVQELRKS